jgi:hypothetical protein
MGQRKKYVLGTLLLVVVISVVIFGAVQLYWYNNPYLEIGYSISEDGVNTLPRLVFSERSIFGCSETAKERVAEYAEKEGSMEQYIFTTYQAPLTVVSHVENQNGQTILTFTGKGTLENGDESEFEESIVFDYILAENIPMQ